MTQEDKKLVIKDICGRLPYKVKIHIGKTQRIEVFDDINIDVGYINNSYADIRPYLFPLSSMTEEQKEFLRQQNWCIAISTSGTIETTIEGFDWLNKNHFDYRGLIPMGLAIDCTNLNIY